jgi:hypothetical protein
MPLFFIKPKGAGKDSQSWSDNQPLVLTIFTLWKDGRHVPSFAEDNSVWGKGSVLEAQTPWQTFC